MLVEHDVEAEFVGQLPLIIVTVKQIGGDARIALAVQQIDAQRAGMIVPRRVVRLLGELVNSHGVCSVWCFNPLLRTPTPFRRRPSAVPDAGNAPPVPSSRSARQESLRNMRGHTPR